MILLDADEWISMLELQSEDDDIPGIQREYNYMLIKEIKLRSEFNGIVLGTDISEQIKELREVAEMYEGLDGGDILKEAADTIEVLAERLSRAELRSCKIKKSERIFNAKLHMWIKGISNENFPKTKVCGLVEYENGTMELIPMEYIIFSDKE